MGKEKYLKSISKNSDNEAKRFQNAIEANKSILSFDLEWFEKDGNSLLEIGYSFLKNGEFFSKNLLILDT